VQRGLLAYGLLFGLLERETAEAMPLEELSVGEKTSQTGTCANIKNRDTQAQETLMFFEKKNISVSWA